MKDETGILNRLPHRYPFLMVDRVVEVSPGRRAVAVKDIAGDSFAALSGRYEDYPRIMLLEAMAKVGALAASGSVEGGAEGGAGGPGYLAGIHDARFGRAPEIGDRVVFTLEFEAGMGGLVRFKGTARVGEDVAAQAGLTFQAPGALSGAS